jgi:Amt family ammonium transporter
MTFIILKGLGLVMTLRADQKSEGLGLDVTQHGEEAYSTGEGSILVLPDEIAKAPAPLAVPYPATR